MLNHFCFFCNNLYIITFGINLLLVSYVSLSSKKYPCDAVLFSYTPSQSLASCVAAHAFSVPGTIWQTISQFFSCACDKRFISISDHINTEGWLFRSWCQHTAGTPFSSSMQQAEGLCSVLKVMQTNPWVKPDYLSGLTRQPYSASLLHPDVLRTFVYHDVTQFCFPLSQGGQGVSTFSPWRFSEAASHKLYLCPKF